MLNRQALVFLGLATLLGLGAAFAARSWLESRLPSMGPATIETSPVVVTRLAIPTGMALEDRHLDIVSWPRSYLLKGALPTIADAQGRVTRRPLAAGEPVLATALMPQGVEAGLVGIIEDKMRALSVKVDDVIGVAGFIKPGARVDVVATLRRIDQKSKLPYSKVIMQDLRVLAIDQTLEQVGNDGDAELVSVVTLEVDPQQAEKLTYISHEARLQLALRNPGDHEHVKTNSTGVSDLLPPRHKLRSKGALVQVIRGSESTNRRF